MKKPWVTLALLGLIVVLAALLISEWGGDTGRGLASEPSAANPAKEQQPVSKIHDAGPSLREPQGQSELPAQSREEFLAAYWGDRWPLVRSGLSPEAVDTLGMPANNVGTWADVEQHFHEHLVTLMQGAEGIMADLFHIDHSNHELVALWDLYSDRDITSEELSLLQEVRKPYQERLHELIARCLGEERYAERACGREVSIRLDRTSTSLFRLKAKLPCIKTRGRRTIRVGLLSSRSCQSIALNGKPRLRSCLPSRSGTIKICAIPSRSMRGNERSQPGRPSLLPSRGVRLRLIPSS